MTSYMCLPTEPPKRYWGVGYQRCASCGKLVYMNAEGFFVPHRRFEREAAGAASTPKSLNLLTSLTSLAIPPDRVRTELERGDPCPVK
jgi:hypothetical protein